MEEDSIISGDPTTTTPAPRPRVGRPAGPSRSTSFCTRKRCGGCGTANIDTTNFSLPSPHRARIRAWSSAHHLPDDRFRQILRLRFGVPTQCHATGAVEMQLLRPRGPSNSTCRTTRRRRSFAVEPMHGLYCRRRWKRVIDRPPKQRPRRAAGGAREDPRGPGLDGAEGGEPAERGRPAARRHQSAQIWDDVSAGGWSSVPGLHRACPGCTGRAAVRQPRRGHRARHSRSEAPTGGRARLSSHTQKLTSDISKLISL